MIKKIYIAGPLFNKHEQMYLEDIAKELEDNKSNIAVTIIEQSKERSSKIADNLNSSLVLNGDGLDQDLLDEANIKDADLLLALTNDDETNFGWIIEYDEASSEQKLIAINLLLEYGYKFYKDDYRYLIHLKDDDIEIAKLLLEYVQDPDIKNKALFSQFSGKAASSFCGIIL